VEPGAGTWHVESFLMSCRVIGKSVETALLSRIAEDARVAGAGALSAELVDSGRNQVAATFLPGHGFTAAPDGRWVRTLEDGGPVWPAWIERSSGGPATAERRGEAVR
jgi:predicted enzyme involved in methoxymalonyl-ACP biosynthesis